MFGLYLTLLETEEDKLLFTEFYENQKKSCLYIAMKITHNQAMAEDALHNAFLRVVKNWKEFSTFPRSKQAALFVLIVKSRAIDLLREGGRKGYIELNEETPGIPAEPDISAQIVDEDGYQKLVSCIRKLPPIYKTVFELRYMQDYKNNEIAVILGIPPKTVSAQLSRARVMLQIMLDREGIGHEPK